MPNIVESLLTLVDKFPSLQELPPGQVKETYELIERYAPTVAKEPILVGPFIRDIIRIGHFDLMVMRKICKLEDQMAGTTLKNNSIARFAVIADEAGNILDESGLKLLIRNVAARLKVEEDDVIHWLDHAEKATADVR